MEKAGPLKQDFPPPPFLFSPLTTVRNGLAKHLPPHRVGSQVDGALNPPLPWCRGFSILFLFEVE